MKIVELPKGTLLFFVPLDEGGTATNDDASEGKHQPDNPPSGYAARAFPSLDDLVLRSRVRCAGDPDLEMPTEYLAGVTPKPLLLVDLTSHVSASMSEHFRRLNRRTELSKIDLAHLAVDGAVTRSDGLASSYTQLNLREDLFRLKDGGHGNLGFEAHSPAVKKVSDSLVEATPVTS